MIKCKHKLFPNLWFKNLEEEKVFNDYLEYKGIFLHKHVYEAFLMYGEKVTYHELSTYIKYDKGLRNVLYRNLSAVEEYYRAKLLNSFDVERKLVGPFNSSVKNEELIDSNGKTSNLYNFSFSKNFTFGKLITMLNSEKLITSLEKEELEKLREFRNKVMHHNFIVISYYTRRSDIESEIVNVEKMCELIYKHLPLPMRNTFQGNVNKCNHLTERNTVPNLEILCLRGMKNGLFN